MRIPGGEETEKGTESRFKTRMVKNFPNLVREVDTQIHEVQRTQTAGPKMEAPDTIKLSKVKDRILKAAKEE